MSVDALKAQLAAHRAEEERLIYALRLAQAQAHLSTLAVDSKEYRVTAQHIADLETSGKHIPKE